MCDKPITEQQLVLQGIASLDKKPILFHVLCFELWNDERHQSHSDVLNTTALASAPPTPCVASRSPRRPLHAVPVALVGECSMPVV